MFPSRQGLSHQVSPTPPPHDRSTSGPSHMPSGRGDNLATCCEEYHNASLHDDELYIYAKKAKYMAALCSRLQDFLNEVYTSEEGKGNYHLSIPFETVLNYDLELAYGIYLEKSSLSDYVHPTVIGFLTGEKSDNNIREILKKGEPATFYNMPNRITCVSYMSRSDIYLDPLTRIESIIDGTVKVCVASDLGLWLIHGFLEEIFNRHRRRQTWKGEFNASDMVVIDSSQFKIIKQPEDPKDRASDYRKDLVKIFEIFKPHFTSIEGMPLFFDELQLDLGNDNEDVEDESFRGFILSHAALKPSVQRLILVHNLHLAVGYCEANDSEIPSDLAAILDATDLAQDWRKLIPNDETDVLYRVYWRNRKPTDGRPPPFDSTTKELLRYMRHVIEHGHQYVKRTDATEFEQYLAKKFHRYLPYILRKLWKDRKMFFNGPFSAYLKVYCDSKILTDPDVGSVSFS